MEEDHGGKPGPPASYKLGKLGDTPLKDGKPRNAPRIPITKLPGTNTFTRGAFQVHPGKESWSKGCIVLDFDEYEKFMKFYRKDNGGSLKVAE